MARTTSKRTIRKKPQSGQSFFVRLFPETAQYFIARRIVDTIMLTCLLSGLFLITSILTYNLTDPSMNTSITDMGTVQNWMGIKGAYVSDLFIQTLGPGSLIIGLTLVAWGYRIKKRQSLSPLWVRIIATIGAALTVAITLARIPATDWLPQTYMGGASGGRMLNSLSSLLGGSLGGWENTLIACIAGLTTIALFGISIAMTKREISHITARTWYIICLAYSFLYNNAQAFKDWVVHYGHPENKPAQPKRMKVIPPAPKAEAPTPIEAQPTYMDEPAFAAPLPATQTSNKTVKVVTPKATEKTVATSKQTSFALGDTDQDWEFPPVALIQEPAPLPDDEQLDEKALQMNAQMLEQVLNDYNVKGEITSVHPGPVVTLYELEPAPGVKSSRVIGLADDIARSMSAVSVRAAVVPGRSVIGIELPNKKRQTVFMYDMLLTDRYIKHKEKLPLILGKDIGGQPIIADLARMPHLLVAGTTGSGKSVAVNTMILSILYCLPPEKCRFLMIDPKMLELSVYDDIPHLLAPVVTDPGKAIVSLKWAVQEMENRYAAMSKLGVRNIEGYNDRMKEARKKGEALMRKVQTGFDAETGKPVFEEHPLDLSELPYIVIIVDEFADLMLVAGKEVENAIQRLAQMARAAGIHLIMATQRPSVDVITGVIKANFPTRISFQVTSKFDSRTILGEGGAEQLLGMGDMLYMAGGGKITRVHGPFATDNDVNQVVDFIKSQGEPSYLEEVTEGSIGDSQGGLGFDGSDEPADEYYDQAVALVAREGKASTSFIQRYFKIGYNRAARIIEEMERQGVVGSANHVGKREVLVQNHDSDAA